MVKGKDDAFSLFLLGCVWSLYRSLRKEEESESERDDVRKPSATGIWSCGGGEALCSTQSKEPFYQ